ncbi:formylglycine-generating enzyme family protein [Varunaivibrio sulfuroxidans]|uniref:Formylglycine-generating enzyme required for sulfatase activity n=1 Tax=Varunaivibrio sulfuroxidans TaxID=1773489 RepID=A0A4R3J8A5_9PROT|nr:formylglycine-generating enzyme family protein [Varunaivibrio sulfuroxidans]TCS61717.1 formylglycine-generating enzyme required for sulfatase activity [Varunaivibrio sulfuroxidans]WES32098.1 formylglycine-generating enzyme family protein [Varunaivibrio sulfuroxidans]
MAFIIKYTRALCIVALGFVLAAGGTRAGAETSRAPDAPPPILAAATPKPFQAFKDCSQCPTMIALPPGAFTMGTNGRYRAERPAHPVSIAYPYAIGKYEVTFDEWAVCVADGGCDKIPDDHGWGRGRRPVINVTWQDARDYALWLSVKTHQSYRLPSEAEWEYAARAGTTSAYSWGNDIGVGRANCRNCAAKISHKTRPVGSYKPNPWGLYDVHGNVWEWTQDCWNPNYKGAPRDGSPWLKGACQNRVMRSGSWYYFSKNLTSAWRFKNDARVNSYGIGFRVVRDIF